MGCVEFTQQRAVGVVNLWTSHSCFSNQDDACKIHA